MHICLPGIAINNANAVLQRHQLFFPCRYPPTLRPLPPLTFFPPPLFLYFQFIKFKFFFARLPTRLPTPGSGSQLGSQLRRPTPALRRPCSQLLSWCSILKVRYLTIYSFLFFWIAYNGMSLRDIGIDIHTRLPTRFTAVPTPPFSYPPLPRCPVDCRSSGVRPTRHTVAVCCTSNALSQKHE